jgi:hypothetical protein
MAVNYDDRSDIFISGHVGICLISAFEFMAVKSTILATYALIAMML